MNISATANATLVPGITITPNDPLSGGGITVMAISYSTLTGIMSFQNVSTSRYLSLSTSASPSLTTSSSIVNPYSRWLVQYDAEWGYIVSNASNIPNTFLGKNSGASTLSIGSKAALDYLFGVTIFSTTDSTLLISDSAQAITSDGSLVTRSWALTAAPASCQWKIMSKTDVTLVSEIGAVSTRVEQSGVDFYLDYSIQPSNANMYEIGLYYADTNTEVTHDTEAEEDEFAYYINTPGFYMVYYKDSVTGVQSENFILIIAASISNYGEKETYSITHAVYTSNSKPLYLSRHTTNGLILSTKSLNSEPIDRGDNLSHSVLCEELADVSRTFTFKYANSSQNMADGVYITATMSTSQYGTTPDSTSIDNGTKYTGSYAVLDSDTIPNTLIYTDSVDLIAKEEGGTLFKICNMGSYYLIIYDTYISNNSVVVNALKMNSQSNGVEIGFYDGSDSFKWRIEQVGVDAPAIKQVYKSWCGPTSFLQVLYGLNVDKTVDGNNLSEQQTTISNAWGIGLSPVLTIHYKDNMNGFKLVDKILEPTNRWLPDNYTCNEIVDPTEQQLRTNIRNSLDDGAACIFFTVSGGKPYKYSYKEDENGIPYAHYICVIGYDEVSDTVILSNCHYSKYRFGIYEVDFSDFCEDVGRLLYFEKLSN